MNDTPRVRLDRRAVIAGLLSAPLAAAGPALASPSDLRLPLKRLAVLDYSIAETLICIGQAPLALVSTDAWNDWVVEPPLPPGVLDLGSNLEPNLELLQQLRPDAILATPYQGAIVHRLARIAPVLEFPVYGPEGRPLDLAIAMVHRLAELTGRQEEAKAFLAEADATFAMARERLAGLRDKPLYMVSFMDARHVRVYGRHSLFNDVLQRIGLPNAYQGETNIWGFATLGLEELKPDPEGRLVYFDPVPPGTLESLARNPIWTHLPVVNAGHVVPMPGLLIFGALPAALRFTRELIKAFAPEGRQHG
ncbi:ABC transporter substrate-binding protein [Xanthobacteraceae bacterium A53D]